MAPLTAKEKNVLIALLLLLFILAGVRYMQEKQRSVNLSVVEDTNLKDQK